MRPVLSEKRHSEPLPTLLVTEVLLVTERHAGDGSLDEPVQVHVLIPKCINENKRIKFLTRFVANCHFRNFILWF